MDNSRKVTGGAGTGLKKDLFKEDSEADAVREELVALAELALNAKEDAFADSADRLLNVLERE